MQLHISPIRINLEAPKTSKLSQDSLVTIFSALLAAHFCQLGFLAFHIHAKEISFAKRKLNLC